MKELNISQVLTKFRHKKGITQEELAYYLGVSKASVSKWETGLSYPDITFLPQLAAYFNISVDTLLGYEPQMEKEDIKKLYKHFCEAFAGCPFDEVYKECRGVVKKYYSCFPLLLAMAYLYVNHSMLAAPGKQQMEVLDEAEALFIRIKEQCQDLRVSKEALSGAAMVKIMQGRPAEALELVGEEISPLSQETEMIATAYSQLGNKEAALKVRQVMAYQYLNGFLGEIPQLLILEAENMEKVEMILERTLNIEESFRVSRLIPNTIAIIYLAAIHVYMEAGEQDKALDYLEKFADMIDNFFPLCLHGDEFFDKIDDWIGDLDLGNAPPRNEKLVKESIYHSAALSPDLQSVKDNERYKKILWKIRRKLGMEESNNE